MKLSTYKRLKAQKYETRGTRRMDVRLEARERRWEFARHVWKFLSEGLLTMPRFSEEYYKVIRKLRLDRFGIRA
jgi:hypothetical protein